MNFLVMNFVLIWIFFGTTFSIYVRNEIERTPKPYTTGLKIKSSLYRPLTEPYYHSNYSKVYVHNKNYTSSLLDAVSTDSHGQASQLYPVYLTEEKKEKMKTVIAEHNTRVVDKDTLNNRVVYKRKIDKSKNIEVFNRCPKGVTGQFVYDLACNQYLDCWNGRGGPRNCAPGTLFNPKTLECDFPQKVECLTGPTGSSLTLQKSAKLQSSYEQAKCPQDFSGLIPNYTDCSKFVQCNNGIQTPRDCPPGTLFDTNLNVCNHATETTCFSGQRESGDGFKGEYGGSANIGGLSYGKYVSQSGQYGIDQGGYQGQYLQYQSQSQPNQFQSQTTYGQQYNQAYGSQGQHISSCDPTNPYCKSGGYVISGNMIYYVHPQTTQNVSSTFSVGRDSRYYSGAVQGQSQQGASPGTSRGTVYIQYVMCNPSTEDCSDFQQGTYMLGPGGALCNPANQQCGQRTSYVPSNKMSGQNAGTTYFVKYVMCNTARDDCSPYQKGVVEAAYGVPGTLIGVRPVEDSQPAPGHVPGCNPQVQNCGSTRPPTSGQPCNPQFQDCTQNPYSQGQGRPSISSSSQVSGSYGKTGQSCNPLYQRCAESHNVNCNPQIQNCDSSKDQNGYYPQTHTTTPGHIPGCNPRLQNCDTARPHTSGQPCNPQYQNCNQNPQYQGQTRPSITATPNYKKICTAGDANCYYNNQNLQTAEAKCPLGFQGMTRHPTSCNKFLNCANGITYVQECGPGTLFNPISNVCDFPHSVNCQGGASGYGGDTGGSRGQQGSDYSNCRGQNCHEGQLPADLNPGQYGQGPINCQDAPCRQGQDQYQGSAYGEVASGGYKGCVGSQCASGNTQDQGGCQGSACGYQFQGQTSTSHRQNCQSQPCHTSQIAQGYTTPSSQNPGSRGYHGETGCQGHQCGSAYERNRGISEIPDYGETTISTTRIYPWQTRHPGPTQTSENSHIMKIPGKPGYQGVQPINKSDRVTSGGFNNQRSVDYVDIFDPDESKNFAYATTTPRSHKKPESQVWPPPFPDLATTDVDADYVFEYEDGEPVTLAPEKVPVEKRKLSRCGGNDFLCNQKSCLSKNFVCDGVKDCENGKDEKYCQKYLDEFKAYKNSRLDVLEKQRWDNISYSTCALLCMDNRKFECKSFNYRKVDNACFLTNENVGSSGALKSYFPCDYYERKSTSMDCSDMHKCPSGKCLTSDQICDGYDDCGDRADERGCRAEDFGYSAKLAAGEQAHEGRIEITVFGKTGYICDDQFSITDANVLCKELGFQLGALEVKGNSFYAKDLKENNTLYMMDDIECIGNETSIMHCKFAGWGIHNCDDREIAGVVCKTPQETCSEGYWKCNSGNECVRLPFVCDGLNDCTDDSDEASHHCDAPTALRLVNGTRPNEGRLEIRHNGIWGSICDDDFNEDAAKIACKTLGFSGSSFVKKDAFFGKSSGPIWLDQVSCKGNESSLEKCTHWDWEEHNCDHSEDVGIVCSNTYFEVEPKRSSSNIGHQVTGTLQDLDSSHSSPQPVSCGYRKDNIFLQNDDVHFRVVQGSLAKPGDYPWQAVLRIKGLEKTAHWCGAVVIAAKWVLTAAHCLEGYPKGAYVVVAGEYNIDENEGTEQQAFIEEYYLHENFRKGHKMGDDIAMILLKGNGFRLNQDIQPICLPDKTTDYDRDWNCTISGFGTVQTGRSVYAHKLRAAWIPIQKTDVCKMAHIYGENINEGMICAGDLTGGIDACDGDSGGPLACLDNGVFTLFGLTSWGHRCGFANKPGVYVKVSHYKEWIEHIMKLHS